MRPSVFKALDEYNRKQADFAAWCKRRQIATDDWITLSGRDANGDKHGGARVLLDDDGAIVYGLGGGHAGKKLGDALKDIKQAAKKQPATTAKATSRFGGKPTTKAAENQTQSAPSKTIAQMRGEKRADAVAAYMKEQSGVDMEQYRSGTVGGYPNYYFPGVGAGGQKEAFIRAVGGAHTANLFDIQDNGGLGVVAVPKSVNSLDANRYGTSQPQKATKARAIENMNEAQLNSEIAKATAARDRLQRTKEQTMNSLSSTMRDSHNNTPLGFGSQDRSKTVNRYIDRERNKFLQAGKKLSETDDELRSTEKRLANLQRALNEVKGTGQTQREKQEQPQKIAPKTMKWATSQKGGYSGGGYKPQIIKSGDYEIHGTSGYYRVFHNGKQISTVSKLIDAKNFAENHSAKGA